MQYGKITIFFSGPYKRLEAFCGRNTEVLSAKLGGIYDNH